MFKQCKTVNTAANDLAKNTENPWVEFKPAKHNMPDSFLIYGGLNLGQFHLEVMLSSSWEKATSTMQIKQQEQLQISEI